MTWSKNGQYVFGTTQEDFSIYVSDIASVSIVQRLGSDGDGGRKGQIWDMFSSSINDTLVSTSFDESVNVWLRDMRAA